MANPLKQVLDIRREEWPLALPMCAYFFLVITTFWVLKPIKKGLFIAFYEQDGFQLLSWHMSGSQAELLAKVLNMGVALVAVTVFTLLARTLQRQQLTFAFSVFFAIAYVLYSLLLDAPSALVVWSFYLFGDLYSTLMVATFFVFLNDSVNSATAKRIYGLVGLGGVAGGAFGSTIVRSKIRDLATSEWMWVCLVLGALIVICAWLAGRQVQAPPVKEETSSEPVAAAGNPALEGGRLVLKSPYLLSIVAIVGLYEMVSTIMDFQFTSTIVHYLDGPEIGVQFSTVFAMTNWVALFVQLFLTSLVMTRFGVGVALLFLPMAALLGSGAFMVAPILLFGGLLNTADNGFSYSINQSAKEVLYVPTTRDEKYKAKAFIDMFVQRFAKALAVGLSLLITTYFAGFESLRWLSLLTVLLLVLWIFAVRYVGRVFAEREAG
ncbi:MAG: AAA family ATP:ADP antiporter [Candidatus Latescibacterota bacterium]|jgi:AAA family ATP:ADP antiporter